MDNADREGWGGSGETGTHGTGGEAQNLGLLCLFSKVKATWGYLMAIISCLSGG